MARQPDQDWRAQVLGMAEPATALTPAPTTTMTAQAPFSAGFPSPPSFDPLDALPPGGAAKMRMQRERCSEKHAAMIPHAELQEEVARRTLAEQNLRRLQAHPQDHGFGLPPTDARVVAAEQQVARASDNARRLQERSEKLAAAWRAAAEPLAACESLLRDGLPSGVQLLDYDGPEPVLLKGEKGLIDAIENRRRRDRELNADLHRIASAPFPSNYAKAKMRAQIETLPPRGEPSVSRLVELDGPVEFQTQRLTSEVHGERRSLAFTEVPDAVALVAWLHKDALIKRLDELIDAEADDAVALSHEAREKAEAEVRADLLAVQREESFFVWQAMEQGLPVEHRGDSSPLAILGLRLVTAPRAAPPPSSPERAGYNLIGGW